MSKATAIAAVTQVLATAISNAFDSTTVSALAEFKVTMAPPDRIAAVGGNDKSRLNIFLYQIVPNQGWRNANLPVRDGRGERINRQPLALDLRYLITPYATDELQAHVMMGVAMQALHEIGVLTRDRIRDAFKVPDGNMMKLLATSEVDQQIEQIKISPYTMSLDDLSKIMNGFQDKYRASAAYEVSVLLIESTAPARSAPPVLQRPAPTAVLIVHPTIEAVEPQTVAPGAQLTLRGYDLNSPGQTKVFVGGANEATLVSATSQSLVVTLPDGVLAGINSIQVIQTVVIDKKERRGFQSNIAAVVVQPRVLRLPDNSDYDITVSNKANSVHGDTLRDADIKVHLAPAVGKRQKATLLLNEAQPPATGLARGYSFDAPSRDLPGPPETTDTLTFKVKDVVAGDYLLRVRVDGAETALDRDLATGQYVKPLVSLS